VDVLARNNVTVRGRVADAFVDDGRVILFDHVGCGGSDIGCYDRTKYSTLVGYAQDVLEICEALQVSDVVIARDFARVTFLSDNRADLPRASVPTLLLQCADDPIAPAPVGEYVHDSIPGSRIGYLQAIDHCPNVSAPAETIQAIRSHR